MHEAKEHEPRPEWLTRSQKVPLAVIAEFTDVFEHPSTKKGMLRMV